MFRAFLLTSKDTPYNASSQTQNALILRHPIFTHSKYSEVVDYVDK